jgi:predicted MPP superfamily phosphohydrolase
VQRSALSFLMFFVVLTLVVGGIHYYLWQRLVRAPELGPTVQRWGTVVTIVLALSLPAGMWLTRNLPKTASSAVSWVVFLWMGVSVLLFFLLLGSELVRGGVHALGALSQSPLDASRRTFLSRTIAGVVGALGVGLAGFGAKSALGAVAVQKVRVGLKRLPAALSGFKVAQITDLHIGPTIGRAWLEQVVAGVNATDPDLVVITGDLVDGSVETLRDETAPLADLRAKHGVFFVTGNHEYYSGADAWIAELERLGIRVLRNERVSIGSGEASFDLAGVDDWGAHRQRLRGHGADLKKALAGRDPSRELLLLAHQPKQIVEAAEHGVGLQLSGHTHGGQIFPWHFFVQLDQPYLAGLAAHGASQIYVSRGAGYWGPPMRVGAPPEIALLELFPGASEGQQA